LKEEKEDEEEKKKKKNKKRGEKLLIYRLSSSWKQSWSGQCGKQLNLILCHKSTTEIVHLP